MTPQTIEERIAIILDDYFVWTKGGNSNTDTKKAKSQLLNLVREARIEELGLLRTKKLKGSNLLGIGLIDKRLAMLRKEQS